MKMSDLGRIVVDDVRIIWMIRGVVLVISLGRIKGLQRNHLSHNRTSEDAGLLELHDISLGNPLLFVAVVENNRTILSAGVGPLPVQLRGIVRHGEKHPQQLAIS